MKGEIAAALIASVFCSAGIVMYCCTCKQILATRKPLGTVATCCVSCDILIRLCSQTKVDSPNDAAAYVEALPSATSTYYVSDGVAALLQMQTCMTHSALATKALGGKLFIPLVPLALCRSRCPLPALDCIVCTCSLESKQCLTGEQSPEGW